MLPILNKFLSTADIIQYKTTFGHIKFFKEKLSLDCDFVNTAQDPCMIFFYAGNQREEYIDDTTFEEVSSYCLQNTKNILVLDTIIEDFVNPPFCDFVEKIISKGVNPDNIKIVTSFNPASKFTSTFLSKNLANYSFDIYSYDGFSSSFVAHQILNKRKQEEIVPRQVEYHFGLMQKNARFLRKLVHAFFISKEYNKKSIYTWHNKGADSTWDSRDKIALTRLQIPIDFDTYSKPIHYDNEWHEDEWKMHDDIFNCALSVVVETTAHRDDPMSIKGECWQHRDNYFLSEKTYKNFWYGMPFIHIGIPFMNENLENLGYKTFSRLFDYEKVPLETNYDGLNNDLNLIDKIASMSIDEIMSILNSPQRIGEYNHNRKMLQRLLPLHKILNDLDKY